MSFSPSIVKSLQVGTVTVGSGASSGTQAVSSVNTNKFILINLGASGSTAAGATARLELTSATLITAYRFAVADVTVVGFLLIELW